MLGDSRFTGLFEDKDFHRDKNSLDYKQSSRTGTNKGTGDSSDDEEKAKQSGGLNSLFQGHAGGKDSTKTVF